ncbi:glucans biosynthesis glucosyltransferase MdoH [Jiella avicenniae]|uniref:Glucans biosynthesis glucosyltransferase H n=1 Tax=Jiella avicenniae TaxID=2907202 RepID=A0A9X1P2Q4_9HYPH|nr:glucans biosynthesis glucosyltransferase MdoH [Jiella avicenniae]MCE7029255.1 glucans biosynthesis glucosyltransferase MdoH [Jiella avicenniae]
MFGPPSDPIIPYRAPDVERGAVAAGTGEGHGKVPIRQEGLSIGLRRLIVLGLNLISIAGLAAALLGVLGGDGLGLLDAVIFAGFLLATPWTVLGFWNAMIGLCVIHLGRPEKTVYPYFAAPNWKSDRRSTDKAASDRPLVSRTDLLLFLRNEAPEPIFARLEAMRRSLEATGRARHFRFALLSDTSDPMIAAAERREFDRFAHFFDHAPEDQRPIYRRREENSGFKAGNLRDFLTSRAGESDFFLPLDSDSVMAGAVIVRMAMAMEDDPHIGILQSLVVGMPAESGFARLFQFGMRHGMRAFTMGSAWWSADCGPYWGHNAMIRTRAFVDHCELPVLPGRAPLGGPVLSHDQLEAVYMRRAGYEVRVVPVETRSYETNPPTLLEFEKRDLRWCQGNMQYWRFLFAPGLLPVSRFQILQAILMYVAPLAWIVMTCAATAQALTGGYDASMLVLGMGLFVTLFFLSVAPKIAGVLDVLLTPGAMRAYGGAPRFLGSALIELFASMLMAPLVAVYVSVFLVGLIFGKTVVWNGQNRDRLGIAWSTALLALLPQTLLGLALAAALLVGANVSAVFLALPFLAGLVLAVPFTVATAAPAFGRLTARLGLFAIPEETVMPPVLRAVVSPEARRWRRPVARGRVDDRRARDSAAAGSAENGFAAEAERA